MTHADNTRKLCAAIAVAYQSGADREAMEVMVQTLINNNPQLSIAELQISNATNLGWPDAEFWMLVAGRVEG